MFLIYSYEIVPTTEDQTEYALSSAVIAGRLFYTMKRLKENSSMPADSYYFYHYSFGVRLGQLIYINEYTDYIDTDSGLNTGITIFDRTLMRWYDNHKDQLADHKNRLSIKKKIGFMAEKLSEYGFNEEAMILLRWLHETGIDNDHSIMMLRIL